MNLFSEILNCSDCPKVEALTETNEQSIKDHLVAAHNGASVNAYIIAVANRLSSDRDWINATYNSAKEFLDTSFASNFLRNFEARCWELSTYQYLIDNGVTINRPTQSAGPDFDTSIGYVECIAVSRGTNANAIPLLSAAILREDGTWSGNIEAQPVPINAMQLRISAALAEKTRKYQGYTQHPWFDSSKPRLIALSWFAEGSTFGTARIDVSSNPLLRTLFATSYMQISLNSSTHEVIETRPSHQPVINNANSTPIDMGLFIHSPEHDNDRIDGVIASNGSPFIYLPDEYIVINNPFTSGLDLSVFTVGKKVKCEVDSVGSGINLRLEQ
jgi:hypothetical protein